ncbi:MAG: integrase arm-type DNA-binding domain-containing protein [Sulfurimonas sp.]|nr:integrase arm-type DNA-binding domain-containing protein [Sulfurimonas sp.]
MPRVITPLNDRQIKALKQKDKAYTKSDGNGLQLLIKPNGSKLWEFLYKSPTLLKRRKTSFGTYPQTELKTARNKRAEYITKIRNGIDPLDEKQEIKKQQTQNDNKSKFTFELLSRALMKERLNSNEISEVHYKRVITAFENDAYPFIGTKPISEVTTSDIKSIISKVAKRGAIESARKLYYAISKTFKTLITRDNADEDSI